MNQYFFGVSKAEKQNILDQHKKVYDGYVTLYGQPNNQQPLYVQDYANDKGGITVSNQGNVSTYKNVGINEAKLDTIGDGPMDLKNGTVDLDSLGDTSDSNHDLMHDVYPSPNEDEIDFISLGLDKDNFDEEDFDDFILNISDSDNTEEIDPFYEFDIDEIDDFNAGPINQLYLEVGDEDIDAVEDQINESLDMFRRFSKYN